MKIELESGMVTNEKEGIEVATIASIPVSELRTIGDNEFLGATLTEFIRRMTVTKEHEGALIDKSFVDLVTKEFDDECKLLIGVNVSDHEPRLIVRKGDNFSFIEKE